MGAYVSQCQKGKYSASKSNCIEDVSLIFFGFGIKTIARFFGVAWNRTGKQLGQYQKLGRTLLTEHDRKPNTFTGTKINKNSLNWYLHVDYVDKYRETRKLEQILSQCLHKLTPIKPNLYCDVLDTLDSSSVYYVLTPTYSKFVPNLTIDPVNISIIIKA